MAPDDKATGTGENTAQVRILKAVVAGLGVLIVIGVGAVIWRMFELASGRVAQTTASAPVNGAKTPAMLSSDLELALPAGAEVRSSALNGDRLSVHYVSPAGSGIAILDLASGRVVSNVRIVTKP